MTLDDLLEDHVVFAFFDRRDARGLSNRLRRTWGGWVAPHAGTWLVGVEVRADGADLAALLHDVVEWLAEADIDGVGFHVDGRVYTLAPPAATPAAAAA
jgi:hypothetical protein